MSAPSVPRTRIRQWWAAQLATGQPVDLDAAAQAATAELLNDPAFVASLDAIVQPLVREIGQKVALQGTRLRGPRVMVGSTVMTRRQAMELVDQELHTSKPHWSKLVQESGEPVWFLGLDRQTLMREATRRKEMGVERLREATFLLAVANNLQKDQVVADVWNERELECLYEGIEVDVKASNRNVTFAFAFDRQKALGAA